MKKHTTINAAVITLALFSGYASMSSMMRLTSCAARSVSSGSWYCWICTSSTVSAALNPMFRQTVSAIIAMT